MILFCSSCIIHCDCKCNSEFTWISRLNVLFVLWQILWQFNRQNKIISLLVGLWELIFKIWILALSRLKLSRKSGFSSRVGTLLIWDSWTLCKGFREVRGHAPWENIRNLRSSNCWKCIEIVNPTTTTLFLYHKSFMIPSGGPFWLLGSCVRLRACFVGSK